jgi:hypothetical protein
VRDLWAPAITKYAGFPLFTRRYPSHGIENFAFDLLLGKPCLIVEHHQFFGNNGSDVVRFVETLSAINARLCWRPLGDLLRRCYQSRVRADGVIEIRMFANELLLSNPTGEECHYEFRKDDAGSAGVCEVTLGEKRLGWERLGSSITFRCMVPPGEEGLVRVSYSPAKQTATASGYRLKDLVKIATRRYLCEIRDNFLCRHTGLLRLAQAMTQPRKFLAH